MLFFSHQSMSISYPMTYLWIFLEVYFLKIAGLSPERSITLDGLLVFSPS